MTGNESLACSMLDASRQGSYCWGKHTIIGCLCSRCAWVEQIESNKCNKGKQRYCYKKSFHHQMPPLKKLIAYISRSHQLLQAVLAAFYQSIEHSSHKIITGMSHYPHEVVTI